jgi:putative endonuclease
MFTVYVIQSASGKRYTGYTSDLERRLLEHNSGLCKTTKVDRNWQVIYSEEFTTRGEAIKIETCCSRCLMYYIFTILLEFSSSL